MWVQVEGFAPVWAIGDEDLERDTEDKTSAVHFLRFELTQEMVNAARSGVSIGAGIDHRAYRHRVAALPGRVRDSLAADLH